MKNKNTTAPAMKAETNNTSSFTQLKEEYAQLQTQATNLQTIANIAANKLIQVETLLSPQMARKPNFWNILFHFKEVILIIQEVIKIIQEFKSQFIRQETPQEDGTTK